MKFGGRAPRRSFRFFPGGSKQLQSTFLRRVDAERCAQIRDIRRFLMAVGAKIAKTADRKKVMDTTKSTDCPKCGKPTRIVKRVKDRERGVPGGIYISCSACEFFEKL
jgi:DNA-directed RNA polymerase subunit M/transcription elongation factor TFIIS